MTVMTSKVLAYVVLHCLLTGPMCQLETSVYSDDFRSRSGNFDGKLVEVVEELVYSV